MIKKLLKIWHGVQFVLKKFEDEGRTKAEDKRRSSSSKKVCHIPKSIHTPPFTHM